MTLGTNIKTRREKLKLSQEYLADQIGVSRQAVSKWETDQSEPTANNLVKLADVLEIDLSELVDSHQSNKKYTYFQKERSKNVSNPILQANLIKIAIIAQVAILFSCTSTVYQLQHSTLLYKDIYRGFLILSCVLLMLSSIWMALNHHYETDIHQRRKNTMIEFLYCCVQLCVALLTIRYGMGLVGAGIMSVVCSVYILYVNPKYMSRKLTK